MAARTDEKGEYKQIASSFREFIAHGGKFAPEPNRYHLYVSFACPFAHRALIMRKLKGLDDVITVDILDSVRGVDGWCFNPERAGCTIDTINGYTSLKEVYLQSNPDYKGRVSVPVLYDKKLKIIVNNESSEIIRILNSEFNEFAKHPERDLYPIKLQGKINEINELVYAGVNICVYRCGFATTQEAYDKSVQLLFNTLDKLEEILSKQRYLCGEVFTEADIRLFTSLIRFDLIYVQHFKCNLKMIRDYPNLLGFLKELYQTPQVRETVNFVQIKRQYVSSHSDINRNEIVPYGPELHLDSPHDRQKLVGQPI